ncbi:MAG: DUF4287 domain-containing protein [Anaerolineales bacterium]|nr:DUF4287 domain-containing protein [Anaerolineales bacterium]
MSSLDQAIKTQLRNVQTRTGKTLEELRATVQKSGLTRHSEIREMLKRDLGMGHGDANMLVHHLFQSDGESAARAANASMEDILAEIYAGGKAGLRPIHDAVMAAIEAFGPFEIAPKKGYLSLRRKKQFAMLGPATNSRVEVGLNMKGVPAAGRLIENPPGGMCQYKIKITDPSEVDGELITWIRQAYDSAG